MNPPTAHATQQLDMLRRRLQQLHAAILEAEKPFHPAASGLEWLDRLTKDPTWSWLRALSTLIAEIDHVASQKEAATAADVAVAAIHVRGLIAGEGDLRADDFLNHYRHLLQLNLELASLHGEFKTWLKELPLESANESERLHMRHQWNVKCKSQR